MPARALPKRGHNKDFALTKAQFDRLIRATPSESTKAMLILASQGHSSTEIGRRYGISSVAVWRRVKKSLLRATEKGILPLDPDRLPFPAALRFEKEDQGMKFQLEGMAKRVHVLNGGVKDLRDPLTDCPHLDCRAMRELIGRADE